MVVKNRMKCTFISTLTWRVEDHDQLGPQTAHTHKRFVFILTQSSVLEASSGELIATGTCPPQTPTTTITPSSRRFLAALAVVMKRKPTLMVYTCFASPLPIRVASLRYPCCLPFQWFYTTRDATMLTDSMIYVLAMSNRQARWWKGRVQQTHVEAIGYPIWLIRGCAPTHVNACGYIVHASTKQVRRGNLIYEYMQVREKDVFFAKTPFYTSQSRCWHVVRVSAVCQTHHYITRAEICVCLNFSDLLMYADIMHEFYWIRNSKSYSFAAELLLFLFQQPGTKITSEMSLWYEKQRIPL